MLYLSFRVRAHAVTGETSLLDVGDLAVVDDDFSLVL